MQTNLADRSKRFFGRRKESRGLFGAFARDAALRGRKAREDGSGRGLEGKVFGARQEASQL